MMNAIKAAPSGIPKASWKLQPERAKELPTTAETIATKATSQTCFFSVAIKLPLRAILVRYRPTPVTPILTSRGRSSADRPSENKSADRARERCCCNPCNHAKHCAACTRQDIASVIAQLVLGLVTRTLALISLRFPFWNATAPADEADFLKCKCLHLLPPRSSVDGSGQSPELQT